MERPTTRVIDLSHVIHGGMVTYKGLPGPHICDFMSREQSAANYDDGSTFQIGRKSRTICFCRAALTRVSSPMPTSGTSDVSARFAASIACV
jgi:hypothetical protein